MSDAFDLDAAVAERIGDQTPFVFTWGGETYEMPPEIDAFAMARIAEGDLLGGFRRLFGDAQYDRLEASGRTFGHRTVEVLLERYADHLGIDLGEAFASSPLSAATARPSRPTSNGSTPSTSETSARAS